MFHKIYKHITIKSLQPTLSEDSDKGETQNHKLTAQSFKICVCVYNLIFSWFLTVKSVYDIFYVGKGGSSPKPRASCTQSGK